MRLLIKHWRQVRGLSQEALAALCDISAETLDRYETGIPHILEIFGRIAVALNLSLHHLIVDDSPLDRALPALPVQRPAGLGPAPPPTRFPRGAAELAVLEALQALAPLPATAMQVAALCDLPHLQVRLLLQALATLGTVRHPAKGYYQHWPVGEGSGEGGP
jgi:transcriptional regulator with XRE-family HTH domain